MLLRKKPVVLGFCPWVAAEAFVRHPPNDESFFFLRCVCACVCVDFIVHETRLVQGLGWAEQERFGAGQLV